jgi:hypothetical protein
MPTRSLRLVALLIVFAAPAAAQVVGVPPPPRPPGATGQEEKTPTGTASIKGRVVAADTGRPLRRAQIRINAQELGGQARTASTDLQGYYELTELPAGRYSILVTRGGYLPMQHGMRRFGEVGAPLQVGDGEAHAGVDFTLARASTISGLLIDHSGQPVSGAIMWAMQLQYFRGQRRLVPISGPGMRTDDTGRFRIQAVPPGDVFVMASSRETWVDDEDPSITYGFSPTYYPGTASTAEAQRVRVGVGQDVSIDFALVPARAATISGIALSGDGTPAGAAQVSLSQETLGPAGGTMSMAGSARATPDGTWKLERVLPGEYVLRATIPGREGRPETMTLPVMVTGSDIEGLVISGDAGVVVTGEVRADDGTTLPAAPRRVNIITTPTGTMITTMPGPAEDGTVGEDGSFVRRGPSGRVLLSVTPLPPGWALKSVDIGGENHAGRPVELASGTRLEGVRIVLTDRFPTVTGQLTDDRGAPTEGVVILFPQDETSWVDGAGAIRSTRPDQSGLYSFRAVRPGDYYAIALDGVPSWQVSDPEFLATLTAHATRLTVREGQPVTQNLRVGR